MEIKWKDECEDHDYPAALSFLSLIMKPKEARKIVNKLKKSNMKRFKAKDIRRSSGLIVLTKENAHVAKDIEDIKAGNKISPMLLVRDRKNSKLIVADGYHRLSAVYIADEDAWISCKIV